MKIIMQGCEYIIYLLKKIEKKNAYKLLLY